MTATTPEYSDKCSINITPGGLAPQQGRPRIHMTSSQERHSRFVRLISPYQHERDLSKSPGAAEGGCARSPPHKDNICLNTANQTHSLTTKEYHLLLHMTRRYKIIVCLLTGYFHWCHVRLSLIFFFSHSIVSIPEEILNSTCTFFFGKCWLKDVNGGGLDQWLVVDAGVKRW